MYATRRQVLYTQTRKVGGYRVWSIEFREGILQQTLQYEKPPNALDSDGRGNLFIKNGYGNVISTGQTHSEEILDARIKSSLSFVCQQEAYSVSVSRGRPDRSCIYNSEYRWLL